MNAHLIRGLKDLYKKSKRKAYIHGYMLYECERCGDKWPIGLEFGVEDFGTNGRPHQPCPFCIPCYCGGIARDVSGIIKFPTTITTHPGNRYFAYDESGKDDACGKMTIMEE